MIMGQCKNCAFYEHYAHANQGDKTPREDKHGWCHRYAPRPLEGGTGTGWSDYEWPSVEDTDGCGEFQKESVPF